MATATKVSQTVMVKEKEWLKLFSNQMTENYTSSVTFMKQLTVVAVSMITYLKNAFPEDSYSTETFAGLQLKILNNNSCADDLARFVSTALQQAFDAFDKKYVHQLALCFYEKSCAPENLIEYHLFEYSYQGEGAALGASWRRGGGGARCRLERVRARTAMLVRALSMFLVQQAASELPLQYDVSLRLYYNQDAPEDYQAPGFSCGGAEDPLEPTRALAVRLGAVHTPFHALVARAYTRGAPPGSREADPSDNSPVMTQVENEDFESSAGDARVRCVCNQEDAGDQFLLTCQYCGRRQHAACYGFLRRAPRAHACVVCAARDPRRAPAAAALLQLEPRRQERLGMFRRCLELCSRRARVSGGALPAPAAAARLLRLLAAHGVVPPHDTDNLTLERKINHAKLDQTIQRFFQDVEVESDSVVERLVAETAAATEDPLGDVLSPLEKISLQNSAPGQVAAAPAEPAHRGADATLQLYRDAIMTHQDVSEELPLSGSHNPVQDVEKIGKKKSMKRKNDDEDWLPKLRSGSRNKKFRATS